MIGPPFQKVLSLSPQYISSCFLHFHLPLGKDALGTDLYKGTRLRKERLSLAAFVILSSLSSKWKVSVFLVCPLLVLSNITKRYLNMEQERNPTAPKQKI